MMVKNKTQVIKNPNPNDPLTVCCVMLGRKLKSCNSINSELEFIKKAQSDTMHLIQSYYFIMHRDQSHNGHDTIGSAVVKGLPESIKHCAIGVETYHPVLDSNTVNKRLLVIEEIGVGDPQLIRHSVIQSQVVGDLRVGQTFVPPCLLEVHCQGVVLEDRRRRGPFSEARAGLQR